MAKRAPGAFGRSKQSKNESAVALGCGVFAIYRKGFETARRLEVRSLPRLRALLGDMVLVGFVRALNATERLDGFLQLMRLNREHKKVSALAADRNHRLLVFLAFGTLYEAMHALDVLHGAGIKSLVGRDSEAWANLDAMRKRWDRNPMLGVFRHKFAHHLGDNADVLRGLDGLGNRRLVMFATDGEGNTGDSTFPFAFEAALRGCVPDSAKFVAALEPAVDDQAAFRHSIQVLFASALEAVGVRGDGGHVAARPSRVGCCARSR